TPWPTTGRFNPLHRGASTANGGRHRGRRHVHVASIPYIAGRPLHQPQSILTALTANTLQSPTSRGVPPQSTTATASSPAPTRFNPLHRGTSAATREQPYHRRGRLLASIPYVAGRAHCDSLQAAARPAVR